MSRPSAALLAAALVVVACSGPDNSRGGPLPSQPSNTSPSTVPAPVPTSTARVDYTLTDCATPPVTFALLCDVYSYLDDHYVDQPLDDAALAAGVALGIESYRGEPADPTTSFMCAVPDPAFESTCRVLADRLQTVDLSIEDGVEAGVEAMVDLSLDTFTTYFPPELSGAVSRDGVVLAVSLLLSIKDNAGSECVVVQPPCRLEVAAAIQPGPAFEAGLRAGDVITAIDGTPVAGSNLSAVAAQLDGEAGSTVAVEVDGGVTLEVRRDSTSYPEPEVSQPLPGVGYLRIPDFDMHIPAFVHEALETLLDAGTDTIVVDLRDNPGGYVDAVAVVASEFVGEGTILRTVGPEGDFEYPARPGGLATTGVDLTVVVNGGSASAAEILAAALQSHGRATIVGTPTFGKNTVQIGFPLRNDGELRVTIARWLSPDGETVSGRGVTPDVDLDIPVGAPTADVVSLALDN